MRMLAAILLANIAVGVPLVGLVALPIDVSFQGVPAIVYYPLAMAFSIGLFVAACLVWWRVCKYFLDLFNVRF